MQQLRRTKAILMGWFIASLALPSVAWATDGTSGTSGPAGLDADTNQLWDSQHPNHTLVLPNATKTLTGHGTSAIVATDICSNTANGIPCLDSATKLSTSVIPVIPGSSLPPPYYLVNGPLRITGSATLTETASQTGTGTRTITATATGTGSGSGTGTSTGTGTWSATGTQTYGGSGTSTVTVTVTGVGTSTVTEPQAVIGVSSTAVPGAPLTLTPLPGGDYTTLASAASGGLLTLRTGNWGNELHALASDGMASTPMFISSTDLVALLSTPYGAARMQMEGPNSAQISYFTLENNLRLSGSDPYNGIYRQFGVMGVRSGNDDILMVPGDSHGVSINTTTNYDKARSGNILDVQGRVGAWGNRLLLTGGLSAIGTTATGNNTGTGTGSNVVLLGSDVTIDSSALVPWTATASTTGTGTATGTVAHVVTSGELTGKMDATVTHLSGDLPTSSATNFALATDTRFGSWTGTATLTNYIPWTATGTGTAQVVTGADSRLTNTRATTQVFVFPNTTKTNSGTVTVTQTDICTTSAIAGVIPCLGTDAKLSTAIIPTIPNMGSAYGLRASYVPKAIGTAALGNSSIAESTGSFLALSQSSLSWQGIAVAPNGDVYASVYGGDIYKQAGGTGNFIALSQSSLTWWSMASAPNGDIYAEVYGGDIYKQAGGTGNFIALSQTSRNWRGMAAAPNGDIYAAVYGGDIYKQAGGTGNFIALSQSALGWQGMGAAPNGDVYACANDVYKQTGGAGNFTIVSGSTLGCQGMTAAANGDIYVDVYAGDIYRQTGGVGSFAALGGTSRGWRAMGAAPNGDVYAAEVGGDIYRSMVTANVNAGVVQARAVQAKSLALKGSTSGTVTVQPAAAAGTWTLTLPTTSGSANQALHTDGTGVASWASDVASNTAITASGATNKIVQYDTKGLVLSGVTAGNSATKDVGTTAGTVAAGDDSRFSAGSGANRALSNLTNPTAINQHLLPATDASYDLGQPSISFPSQPALRFRDAYLSGGLTAGGGIAATGFINGSNIDYLGNTAGAAAGSVVKNTAITGATKTKITYDAKGLVTAGADATYADVGAEPAGAVNAAVNGTPYNSAYFTGAHTVQSWLPFASGVTANAIPQTNAYGYLTNFMPPTRITLYSGSMVAFASTVPIYSGAIYIDTTQYPSYSTWSLEVTWKQSAGAAANVTLATQAGSGLSMSQTYIPAVDNSWYHTSVPIIMTSGNGIFYAAIGGGNGLSAGVIGEMTIMAR